MINHNMTGAMEIPDDQLVGQSLRGSREAFGEIVARYQSLVCALAFNATGSLSQSEDLAQETFLTAWKKLGDLREASALRPWLCGIARNHINNWLRSRTHEPSQGAQPLETAPESPAPEPAPAEAAISREEEAILWRALGEIPELYREPLVLFYREHQSVEKVAGALELSEDAVKQRLSRGRKLLHEQVLAHVERTLERTNPGRAFTLGVLGALSGATLSAQAAAVGSTAIKGGAAAKAMGLAGWLNAIAGPLLVIFGNYLGYRVQLDMARTEREREYIKKYYRELIICILGLGAATLLVTLLALYYGQSHPLLFATLIGVLVAAYILVTAGLARRSTRNLRQLHSELQAAKAEQNYYPVYWEYRSRAELFGWPLVHVRIGGGKPGKVQFVRAWIAAGDGALGLLFGFGGMAIAPISIGGLAIGLLPFGGAAIGVAVLGGLAIGVWSFGGCAVGWQAFGGFALAWQAAMGGAAVAHDFALGGFAHALQANSQIVEQTLKAKPFFRAALAVTDYIVWLNALWIVPMLVWWKAIKRGKAQK